MSAATFNLTGDYCINRGESLVFTAAITGESLTGASFDSYLIRNFDRQKITGFLHNITNTGAGLVTYTLPQEITSGLDYAASSWKSFFYPSGDSPILLMTGIVNVKI